MVNLLYFASHIVFQCDPFTSEYVSLLLKNLLCACICFVGNIFLLFYIIPRVSFLHFLSCIPCMNKMGGVEVMNDILTCVLQQMPWLCLRSAGVKIIGLQRCFRQKIMDVKLVLQHLILVYITMRNWLLFQVL